MDDIVDSFIIEDELPEPRRRRPATASSSGGSGDDGGSKVGSGDMSNSDFLDCCSILIPCNLPVHAGLWLVQYANLLSLEEGPLAIVRLSGNNLEIQVFGDGITLPTLSETDSDSLLEVMAWLVSTVKRVLIVPSPIDRDVDLLASGLPLQLVTGTDPAAVVGTYQRAKGLCMASQSLHHPTPTIGLVMVGAKPAIGQKASATIVKCAGRFLESEITLDAIVHRMDVLGPQHSVSIKRDSAYQVADLVAAIRRSASMPEEPTVETPTYLEDDVLQVIDSEEYAELESVFDQADEKVDAEREDLIVEDPILVNPIVEHANDTHVPPSPVVDHVPEAVEELDDSMQPRDKHGNPIDLLSFLPELRPVPIHDIPNMTEPGVAYGIDSQQRLHLVSFGSEIKGLAFAERRIRASESQLRISLEAMGMGTLAPFSGLMQCDVLLPESNASMVADFHRGQFSVHLVLDDDGSELGRRCVKLD